MNRLKSIKGVAEFKELILLHKESIKKAALPVTVVAALLFFWISGEIEKKEVSFEDNVVSDETFESNINSDFSTEENTNVEANSEIYVDIGGCVYNPGVYKVKQGTRLFEVIEKAGGLTEKADTNNINRAEAVYDGQKILIHATESSFDQETDNALTNENPTSDGYITSGNNGKININTANFDKLQEIPGVGPSTAQKIIDYRQNVGRFTSIEDIKNVSGIGDKTFANMKEYITV